MRYFVSYVDSLCGEKVVMDVYHHSLTGALSFAKDVSKRFQTVALVYSEHTGRVVFIFTPEKVIRW